MSVNLKAKALRDAQYRVAKREAGRCIYCAEQARPSRVSCAICSAKITQRSMQRAARRYAGGLCRWCDEPRAENRRLCRECLVKEAKRYADYKQRKGASHDTNAARDL